MRGMPKAYIQRLNLSIIIGAVSIFFLGVRGSRKVSRMRVVISTLSFLLSLNRYLLVKTTVLIFLSAIARAWVVSPYLWGHLDWTLPFGKLFNKVYSFG